MSTILLTDFVLGNPGTPLPLLSGGQIFVNIFCDEKATSPAKDTISPAIKIRRFGPLMPVPVGCLWVIEESSFEVPPDVRSLTVAVSVNSRTSGNIIIGGTKLNTKDLQALSLRANNIFFETLANNGHNATLIISSSCMYVPPVEELSLNVGLSPHLLAQNPLILPGQRDPGYRSRKIGDHFLRRCVSSTRQADIEKAIAHLEHAIRLTPDGQIDKPACLNNLGNLFLTRFRRSGDPIDIEKAIFQQERALHLTPDGHPDKASRLSNLGNSLEGRFNYSGDLLDIEKAIYYHEHALQFIVDGHDDMSGYLNNLGNSLLSRFERSRDLVDVDKAIFHHLHALRLAPDGHPDRNVRLINLGGSFFRRFEHSRDHMDIENAISHHQQALNLVPDGHPDKPSCLTNLGISFRGHFEYSGDLTDIEKAISHLEHAVSLTPDGHADKPRCLSNLGTSLAQHFKHSGDLLDIDKAISYHDHALRLTPDGHARMASCLHNLGNTLVHRFDHSGNPVDIERAISYHERAVHLIPDGHGDKIASLTSLGNSSIRRFDVTGDTADLQQAIFSFKACAKSAAGRPSPMLEAALTWARMSNEDDPSASLAGYETAISLLPRVAWLGQSLSDRYEQLASIGSIATEAAAAAIASGRLDTALEWLEQARSVIWGQLLNLRTPVDDLRKVNPTLADDLLSTARALENTSTRDTTQAISNKGLDIQLSLEQAAQNHRRLAEKWDELLESARMLPGFEEFLLPKRLSTLSKAATSGPVVVINVHKSRSDALVLLSGLNDVVHIPLDNGLYDKAHSMQRSLDSGLRAAGMRARDMRVGRLAAPEPSDPVFPSILAGLWSDVVKPVLDGLGFNTPNTSDPPRIWWCPTGPLTFLPIHAAGSYTPSGHNISDFAISSYTPTVTALLEVSQQTPKAFNGLLGVTQSNTPGLTILPNADKELDLLMSFDSSLNIRSLRGKSATVERVLEGMEESSWVHLACHAIQDPSSPTESAFCLENGHLTLSKMIPKSFPNADFAFLSACETATGDKNLPEEAVHLAAGMLAAGYRSVIATMWSIGDEDAPLIASEVYPRLVNGPVPDSSMAASALHHAIKRLREKLGTGSSRAFLGWVPFIHVGK